MKKKILKHHQLTHDKHNDQQQLQKRVSNNLNMKYRG